MSSGKAFISLTGRASSSPDQARGDPSASYVSIAYHVKIPLPIRSQLAHRRHATCRTMDMINAQSARAESPCEVFPQWNEAQLAVSGLAREPGVAWPVLRTTGFLRPDLAELITDWFLGKPTASEDAVHQSYRALERETARLYEIVCRARSSGGLGVRVHYVRATVDPYGAAAELCAELRQHRTMSLTTIACDGPHPLLGGVEGGVVDQLRVVHDVFGHAALGVGFDLQSEFATWLQCRTLFSAEARGAAFCELVGAVTTYIATGEKPGLRADLPPKALVAACAVDGGSRS
jgi:hypothetical protein